MVGARVGPMRSWGGFVGGNDVGVPTRELFRARFRWEIDAGLRIDPHWSVFAFYERGVLKERLGSPESAWTEAYGFGADVDVLPQSPVSIVVDMGFGMRKTFTVVQKNIADNAWVESSPATLLPLRLGIGPSYRLPHARLDLLFAVDLAFWDIGGRCPDGCRSLYGFYGLTLNGRGWL